MDDCLSQNIWIFVGGVLCPKIRGQREILLHYCIDTVGSKELRQSNAAVLGHQYAHNFTLCASFRQAPILLLVNLRRDA